AAGCGERAALPARPAGAGPLGLAGGGGLLLRARGEDGSRLLAPGPVPALAPRGPVLELRLLPRRAGGGGGGPVLAAARAAGVGGPSRRARMATSPSPASRTACWPRSIA